MKIFIVSLLTCICSSYALSQVRNATPQPTPTAAASPRSGREVVYYTITLTNARVSVHVPDASNFLADPVGTLRKQGFKVTEASEPHWRALTVALRRLANPTLPPSRVPLLHQALFRNDVIRLQLPRGWIPVVGDWDSNGTISAGDFLSDPIRTLKSQGIEVRSSDELAWRQLADSLNELRHESSKSVTSNVRASSSSAAKDPKAGIKEIEAEKEKEKSESRRSPVTGRVTGVAVDPDRPKQQVANPQGQPDLIIKQFLFPPTSDKSLRVQIANQGEAASANCRLVLTITTINGSNAARQTQVVIPALEPGKSLWLLVDAKNILPTTVSLAATRFKLNADATGIVAESDEGNNEVSHD